MKFFLPAMALFLLPNMTFANSAMKPEGTCQGALKDGTPVSFAYFSDFDGCKEKSESAITFTEGREGLHTGSRIFSGDKDVYTFSKDLKVVLNNSTGNTEATLRYLNDENKAESVVLQCEVRDYEYLDC